jgi:hypothetical protein
MVTVNRVWSGWHARASPQEVRLALMTAVPPASAVKSVRTGVQPRPGIEGQLLGLASRTVGPSCRSTRGAGLAATSQ